LFAWEGIPTFLEALKGTTLYLDNLGLSRKTRKREFGFSNIFVQLPGTDLWQGELSLCFVEKDGCMYCHKTVSGLKREKPQRSDSL
jgi:hypothetical protein